MDELTASVTSFGDPDVGIVGGNCTVTLGISEFIDNEQREIARKTLRALYADLWDETPSVTFNDEWDENGYPLRD